MNRLLYGCARITHGVQAAIRQPELKTFAVRSIKRLQFCFLPAFAINFHSSHDAVTLPRLPSIVPQSAPNARHDLCNKLFYTEVFARFSKSEVRDHLFHD